jgi:hypothetical protein
MVTVDLKKVKSYNLASLNSNPGFLINEIKLELQKVPDHIFIIFWLILAKLILIEANYKSSFSGRGF